MEALASGAAVVASDVGAIPEMVIDGECGFLCAPGDYAAFADRIRELAANRDMLRRFRKNAREVAERSFDRQAMLREYEARLRSLIPKTVVAADSGHDKS
jgi:glycosyltransferase involved in cell wall biosynthesis